MHRFMSPYGLPHNYQDCPCGYFTGKIRNKDKLKFSPMDYSYKNLCASTTCTQIRSDLSCSKATQNKWAAADFLTSLLQLLNRALPSTAAQFILWSHRLQFSVIDLSKVGLRLASPDSTSHFSYGTFIVFFLPWTHLAPDRPSLPALLPYCKTPDRPVAAG